MAIGAKAMEIISKGEVKLRVERSGMFQQMTFKVKVVQHGNVAYTELHIKRQVDLNELLRLANEVGLPVEAENGRAFPTGTSAMDFVRQ